MPPETQEADAETMGDLLRETASEEGDLQHVGPRLAEARDEEILAELARRHKNVLLAVTDNPLDPEAAQFFTEGDLSLGAWASQPLGARGDMLLL